MVSLGPPGSAGLPILHSGWYLSPGLTAGAFWHTTFRRSDFVKLEFAQGTTVAFLIDDISCKAFRTPRAIYRFHPFCLKISLEIMRRLLMKLTAQFVLLMCFLSLLGCSNLNYITKLAWHQGYITVHSVPIQEVLNDPKQDPGIAEKIRFIQTVKRYGEERIGLRGRSCYSTFYEDQGPILYIVTACEKDRLRAYHWNFPIIGTVSYKGFFSKTDAIRERRELEKKGYDTCLRPAGAYSTLGYLRDPIFSSFMKWDVGSLANLILHEMTHSTCYFKGNTDFNEQMATFIGNQGSILFLSDKYGPESAEVSQAIQSQHDALLFSRWIDQACELLSEFYKQKISQEEKLEGRKGVFRSLQEDFKGIKPLFQTDTYETFDEKSLNNAILLADRQYYQHLESFETVYRFLGRDLRRVVALMKEIHTSGEEPFLYLDHWIKARRNTAPSLERIPLT